MSFPTGLLASAPHPPASQGEARVVAEGADQPSSARNLGTSRPHPDLLTVQTVTLLEEDIGENLHDTGFRDC